MGKEQQECGSGVQAGDGDEKTESGAIQREGITEVLTVSEGIRITEGRGNDARP